MRKEALRLHLSPVSHAPKQLVSHPSETDGARRLHSAREQRRRAARKEIIRPHLDPADPRVPDGPLDAQHALR